MNRPEYGFKWLPAELADARGAAAVDAASHAVAAWHSTPAAAATGAAAVKAMGRHVSPIVVRVGEKVFTSRDPLAQKAQP